MTRAFAQGTVHGGWRVVGPAPDGAAHRWPVERDGRSATLTYFPLQGPRASLHRAIAERHAAWRRLDHEGLQRVDTGVVDGCPYVVLPAFERLGDGPLPVAEALAAIERAAEALTAFHGKGLVHGEVDPWSLVKRDGQVALLPPGLRSPPPGLEALGLQADPRYAAPEVLDGQPPTSEADVCALGLVLLRLVSGKAPASGADPCEVLLARGALTAPDLAKACPEAPPAVVALYRCLTAPRGLRPADAAAALALVRQAARGSAPHVPSRAARPPRPVTVGGPLIVLLVMLAIGYGLWAALETRLALVESPFAGFTFLERDADGR
ncbi:MAG: hypothetical protein M9894_37565 [Planctomycetes bacterium]|nr:hypothetical protein [Planctomycetota bacterium]